MSADSSSKWIPVSKENPCPNCYRKDQRAANGAACRLSTDRLKFECLVDHDFITRVGCWDWHTLDIFAGKILESSERQRRVTWRLTSIYRQSGGMEVLKFKRTSRLPEPLEASSQPQGWPDLLPPAPTAAPLLPAEGGKRLAVPPDRILQLIPERLGQLRLNTRSGDIHTDDRILGANEASIAYLHLSNAREKWPKEATADAITAIAAAAAFDPVADYLNGLPTAAALPMEQWERLDEHLLGIDDPTARSFLPRFFIGGVARTFLPGCTVRQSPVLIGPQRRGKTQLGKTLFGVDHWIEGIGALDKDSVLRAHTAWGVELAEMNGVTRRSDQEALKAFLTETADVCRRPYDRAPERWPRRFVFWGTANAPPLRDSTGSTRFVCIPIPDRMLPLDWAAEHRDAIWARAVQQYRAGVEWDRWSDDEAQAIADRNDDFTETDPWADSVAGYLERRRTAGDLPVKVTDILGHLQVPIERQDARMNSRARAVAESLGWQMRRVWVSKKDNIRPRGLWPAGDTPGTHQGHTGDTPPDPAPAQGSGPGGHRGHTKTNKVGLDDGGECDSRHIDTAKALYGTFAQSGVSPCPPPADQLQRSESEPNGGVSPGVSPPLDGCPPPWASDLLRLRADLPAAQVSQLANLMQSRHGVTTDGRTVAKLLRSLDSAA